MGNLKPALSRLARSRGILEHWKHFARILQEEKYLTCCQTNLMVGILATGLMSCNNILLLELHVLELSICFMKLLCYNRHCVYAALANCNIWKLYANRCTLTCKTFLRMCDVWWLCHSCVCYSFFQRKDRRERDSKTLYKEIGKSL